MFPSVLLVNGANTTAGIIQFGHGYIETVWSVEDDSVLSSSATSRARQETSVNVPKAVSLSREQLAQFTTRKSVVRSTNWCGLVFNFVLVDCNIALRVLTTFVANNRGSWSAVVFTAVVRGVLVLLAVPWSRWWSQVRVVCCALCAVVIGVFDGVICLGIQDFHFLSVLFRFKRAPSLLPPSVGEMGLEAHLQQAVLLKKVVDAMKDLCKDVNFECSEKGIEVQSMDSSHVALVSVLLREAAFSDFKCDRAASLGMNVDSLGKIFKMVSAGDALRFRWQDGADTVSFQCESGDDDRIAEFDLKLMQIESEHMEIPEQQYKVITKLPSSEFQKICRDLKEFGETMQMRASKEGITFSVQGDIGTGNVMLKPRESEKPEERVTLTVHEPVTATFALRYLVNFAKAAPLCGTVELGMGPDAPLMVKYHLESADNGHMQFYLAPKIDE